MFSPHVVDAIGYLSLGVLAFLILLSFRGFWKWRTDRKNERAYIAGEARREETVDRFMTRSVPKSALTPKPKPKAAPKAKRAPTPKATPKPKTAAVKTVTPRPKSAPVAEKTTARAKVSQKWDIWSDSM